MNEDAVIDNLHHRVSRRAGNKCECCGAANWSIGGRDSDMNFHPAQPIGEALLRPVYPKPGVRGWCGKGGPQFFLRIIRIVCEVTNVTGARVPQASDCRFFCQRCKAAHARVEDVAA